MSNATVHSAIARYQRLITRAGVDEVRDLAQQVESIYGQPNNPTGAGIEAVALSEVLGCDRTQDAVEVFRSLVEPSHTLRQRLNDYLAAL